MAAELDQLRRRMPDLARVDPLSTEVCQWLDQAYEAVRKVDPAEGVIFRMQQRYLLDAAEKIVASGEIAETIERAARTSAALRRLAVAKVT